VKFAVDIGFQLFGRTVLGYAMLFFLLGFLLLDPTLHNVVSKLKRVKICYIGLSSSEEEIFCWKDAVLVVKVGF